jgi:hypothetical protein
MSEITCESCPHYDVFRVPISGEPQCVNGQCRRYPKTSIGHPNVYGASDWCGEHPGRRSQVPFEGADSLGIVRAVTAEMQWRNKAARRDGV